MALTAAQQRRCREQFVDELREMLGGIACKFTKPELEAAAGAVDSWCEANSASYNSALPAGFRTNATAAEKSLMLAIVALRRYGR